MPFIEPKSSIETYWRAIILIGRNVASYKFALAKSLLEMDTDNNSLIRLDDLALPFAKNICEHLITADKQITSSSSTFLGYCRKYNTNEIDENKLKTETIRLGFVNVIDAFHNVSNSEVPRFFEDSRTENNGIILTDNFFELVGSKQSDNFKYEANARWKLWETAISMGINANLLQVKSDFDSELIYAIGNDGKRIDVTSSRDALNGYQKGKCFFCVKPILIEQGHENSCHVDHFFPHTLINHIKSYHKFQDINGIWNLVLACPDCNNGFGGKFASIPRIHFLEKLHGRNNYYTESHHPLRATIKNQTGENIKKREVFLQDFYNKAFDIIPISWEPKEYYGESN